MTEESNAGRVVAGVAAGYPVNNGLLRTTQTLAQQLQFALDSRHRHRTGPGCDGRAARDDARRRLRDLRDYTSNRRTKLHQVADDIVAGTIDAAGGRPAADGGASST